MKEESRFHIQVQHVDHYQFNVKFDWDSAADLLVDESSPLGEQNGPNASRLLAAATANCLSASLLFCLQRNEVEAGSIRAEADCMLTRNDQGRLRVGKMEVTLILSEALTNSKRLQRCMDLFEEYCVVTASVRQGIAVDVTVKDADGRRLHTSKT